LCGIAVYQERERCHGAGHRTVIAPHSCQACRTRLIESDMCIDESTRVPPRTHDTDGREATSVMNSQHASGDYFCDREIARSPPACGGRGAHVSASPHACVLTVVSCRVLLTSREGHVVDRTPWWRVSCWVSREPFIIRENSRE
jgi:hypothetical protein